MISRRRKLDTLIGNTLTIHGICEGLLALKKTEKRSGYRPVPRVSSGSVSEPVDIRPLVGILMWYFTFLPLGVAPCLLDYDYYIHLCIAQESAYNIYSD